MLAFFIIFSLFLALFLISIKIKDNSIVDTFWWTWFVIIAITLFLQNFDLDICKIIVLCLIIFWWLRLSYYIWKRKLKEKNEDQRYAKWRKKWKYFYTRSFFQVYLLQMSLMFIISIPIFFIFRSENLNPYIFTLWLIISIIWLSFEIIADNQVKNFIKNKEKKKNIAYTWWLYKYTRNPNYFWESIFWLWISIVWLSESLFSLVWFLVITYLLLYVSWVPMKEESMKKKDNWESYKKSTNKFIPWFKNK